MRVRALGELEPWRAVETSGATGTAIEGIEPVPATGESGIGVWPAAPADLPDSPQVSQ